MNDFSLKCWGMGSLGQLGLGNTTSLPAPSATPIDLGTGVTAMKVAVGGYHTCALVNTGTVRCWGFNSDGQLGYGDTTMRGNGSNQMGSNLAAVDIGGDNTAISIDAGSVVTCVVRSDAKTVCWGSNSSGALGISSNTSLKVGDGANEMGSNLVASGSSNTVALAVGAASVCNVSESAALSCWGYNLNKQLGIDSATSPVTTPTTSALDARFSGTLYVQQIAAGSVFACALFCSSSAFL
ncbi:MAG: hypothetical protein EBU84_16960 [Actinobacteria bacterium]|nr:hypothetical protein [Actinomycetota bacterium]